MSVSSGAQITGWSIASPFYGNAGFDATAGNFTVPSSGRYSIKATINYSTTLAITGTIGSANPSFIIRKTSPTVQNLINALFPLLNLNVALLNLRAILGNGAVVLAGDVELSAGDVIGLFYVSDGLSLTLNLGGANAGGMVWSMHRIS